MLSRRDLLLTAAGDAAVPTLPAEAPPFHRENVQDR